MSFFSKKTIGTIIGTAIFILALGVILGFHIKDTQPQTVFKSVREESTNYKFISPFLFLEVSESESFPQYKPLKQILTDAVHKTKDAHKAEDVSVYVRDLNQSRWVGVNSQEKFSAASMLKVVTLMTVLRAAQTDPELLNSKITIASSNTSVSENQDYFPAKNPIQIGQTYTVQNLLSHLIIESDNNAGSVLYQLAGEPKIKETFDDLQVPMPNTGAEENVTAQQYSHLFRALYNGTYLSRSLSEQVLDLLSRTTFNEGIVSGLPTGTLVSHKFGQRTLSADSHQLHDCGIVYYPEHPYFICVMTRGTDFPTLATIIGDMSRLTWNEFDRLYSK